MTTTTTSTDGSAYPSPIVRGPALKLSTAVALADDQAGALLSTGLQDRARRYVAARRRSGDALLEAVAELAAARAEAQHGEWGIFLEACGLDDSTARAQIRIHEAATADPRYAEKLRTGWLSESTARELLAAPPDVQAEILERAEPPTQREIKAAKRGALPALPAAAFWQAMSYHHPTAHLWSAAGDGSYRSACGIRPDRAPFGTRDSAGHCSRCASAAGKDSALPAAAELQATEDQTEDRELTAGFDRDLCHRAEALGAQIDYLGQRADGRLPVLAPPGWGSPGQWTSCDAGELATLCDAWETAAESRAYAAAPDLHTVAWPHQCAIDAAVRAHDRASAIRAALALADALAPAALHELAETLDDRDYEALAVYRHYAPMETEVAE